MVRRQSKGRNLCERFRTQRSRDLERPPDVVHECSKLDEPLVAILFRQRLDGGARDPIVRLRSARNEVSDELQDKVAKSDFGGRFNLGSHQTTSCFPEVLSGASTV